MEKLIQYVPLTLHGGYYKFFHDRKLVKIVPTGSDIGGPELAVVVRSAQKDGYTLVM